MVRSIVITGASKGIGRATADALVEGGWSVIGVARSSPANFPGVFIEADLADREKTQDLADDLMARGNVVGIVDNVGLARHERVDPRRSGRFRDGDGLREARAVVWKTGNKSRHFRFDARTDDAGCWFAYTPVSGSLSAP
jgi:NAD(P)-dependent dehydrogenase (short-subunit alcohol dehydrogenase family)